MRIDKKLNLVIPVETESKGTVFVHSVPLRRDVFEKYFLIISKTFAAIYAEGLNAIVGPRIAYLMLKKIAQDAEVWDVKGGIQEGLIAEINRTTTVVASGQKGWDMQMLSDAIYNSTFSEDELDEIQGAIVFFICASAIHKRDQLAEVLGVMEGLWATSSTLLNCTEYRDYLQKSTQTEPLMPAEKKLVPYEEQKQLEDQQPMKPSSIAY